MGCNQSKQEGNMHSNIHIFLMHNMLIIIINYELVLN
jgi:hypothetical protein